jgi:hypothetical protein
MGSELMFIQGPSVEERGYIGLGVYCADACKALDRGLNGRELDELSQPVLEAIDQLTS